jgi:hypothetical protein
VTETPTEEEPMKVKQADLNLLKSLPPAYLREWLRLARIPSLESLKVAT